MRPIHFLCHYELERRVILPRVHVDNKQRANPGGKSIRGLILQNKKNVDHRGQRIPGSIIHGWLNFGCRLAAAVATSAGLLLLQELKYPTNSSSFGIFSTMINFSCHSGHLSTKYFGQSLSHMYTLWAERQIDIEFFPNFIILTCVIELYLI